MKHHSDYFSSEDGLKLHTQTWLPDHGSPKALIMLAHGYAEHSGRYAHVAQRLVQEGYGIVTLDHRGHGKSEGLRAYFANFEQPVADLERLFGRVQREYPQTKCFLLGHSMGTLISLGFALKHQTQLAGLVLSGTALTGDELVAPTLISVASVLARIIPKVALLPPIASQALSHDTSIQQQYDADPLNYRGAWRVGMGNLLIQVARRLRQDLGSLTLPLLVMHGEADVVTPISGGKLIYERANSRDKTLLTYPDMFHEIFNELDRERVLNDLVAWLNKR